MSTVSLSLMLAHMACGLKSAMVVGWMLGWRLVHGPVHPIRLGILFRHWTETSTALRPAPSLPAPLSLALRVSHTVALLSLPLWISVISVTDRQTDRLITIAERNSLFRLFNRVLFNPAVNWPCIFYHAHLHEDKKPKCLVWLRDRRYSRSKLKFTFSGSTGTQDSEHQALFCAEQCCSNREFNMCFFSVCVCVCVCVHAWAGLYCPPTVQGFAAVFDLGFMQTQKLCK